MQEEKRIRFGIVGCGMIAHTHAKAIHTIPGTALVGVCDRDEGRSRQFGAMYGAASYPTLSDMLHTGEIDAVCICTPSGAHMTDALQVMEAGCHVLIEKPMALTPADCDRLLTARDKYGITAGVMSQIRYARDTGRVRNLVQSGALGKIVTAELSMKYHRSPDYYAASPWRGTYAHDGGGALMNQGIHGIDMLLHIMGNVTQVYGLTRTLAHQIETEDTAAAVLAFASGAIGTLQGTTSVCPGYPRTLTISGTKGTVGMTEDRITLWDIPDMVPPEDLHAAETIATGARNPGEIGIEGHAAQIGDFVSAIRLGQEPAVGLADGKRTVELICAIYRAADRQEIVTLG